jgi:CDP-diacylglycerol--glycerol-3-phosphate 3-phosphatidyltransferase
MKLNYSEISTKSNLLSLFRLILSIPIFFLLREINTSFAYRITTVFVLLFAASTDILDGYLARKFNEVTEFGKIIDPLADKVVIGVIIIQLYMMDKISDFFFFIVIGRDILIFFGGILVSKKIGKVLPSNYLGKITVIFIGIYILTVIMNLEGSFLILYRLIYYLTIALVFASLAGYIIRAKESLTWYRKYGSVQEL